MASELLSQLCQRTSPRLAELLLAGVSKAALESALADEQGLTEPAAIDVARMNLIGGLRSWGFEIPKQRGFYKVVGTVEYVPKPTIDDWSTDDRLVLARMHSLPRLGVTRDDHDWVVEGLSHGERNTWHERSPGYLFCYELGARGVEGFRYELANGHRAVILQKFTTRPRMRIFQLSLTPEEIVALAHRLGRISCGVVRVINATDSIASAFEAQKRTLQPSSTPRRQAIYDCKRIIDNLESIVGKRLMTTLRKHERELTWRQLPNPIPIGAVSDMNRVIKTWREHNEKKHRQLAIGRDYASVLGADELDFTSFIGYRGDLPVCIQIFSRVVGTTVTALVTEKSLNYSVMPGGKYGTADFNLVQACSFFVGNPSLGITHINAGGYDGGGWGLPQHKERYARVEDDVYSRHIDLYGVPYRQD